MNHRNICHYYQIDYELKYWDIFKPNYIHILSTNFILEEKF
jgi:hypothetical protein